MTRKSDQDFDVMAFVRPVEDKKPEDIKQRVPSELLMRIARTFVDSGDARWEIDYEKMGRKFNGVAQDLRLALKIQETPEHVKLYDLAQVSISKEKQIIWLKRRPEGWTPPAVEGRGRPRGKSKHGR